MDYKMTLKKAGQVFVERLAKFICQLLISNHALLLIPV